MSLQLARVCLLRRRFKTLFLLNLFIKLVFSFRASHSTNECRRLYYLQLTFIYMSTSRDFIVRPTKPSQDGSDTEGIQFDSSIYKCWTTDEVRWGLCPSIRPCVWIIFGLLCPVSCLPRCLFRVEKVSLLGSNSNLDWLMGMAVIRYPALLLLLVSKDKHNWLNQSKSIWSMYLMFVNSQNLLSLNVEWKASEEKGNGQAAAGQ